MTHWLHSIVSTLQEMAFDRAESKRRVHSYTEQIAEHLIKIHLMPDHISANHWKREVRTFSLKLVFKTYNGKFLSADQFYEWAVPQGRGWDDKDIVQLIIEDIAEEYDCTSSYSAEQTSSFICSYFKYLGEFLAKGKAASYNEVLATME